MSNRIKLFLGIVFAFANSGLCFGQSNWGVIPWKTAELRNPWKGQGGAGPGTQSIWYRIREQRIGNRSEYTYQVWNSSPRAYKVEWWIDYTNQNNQLATEHLSKNISARSGVGLGQRIHGIPGQKNFLRLQYDVQETQPSQSKSTTSMVDRDANGKLKPKPGYAWVDANAAKDFRTYWKPGSRHAQYPHIYASQNEGKWNLDKGAQWAEPGTNNLDSYVPILLPPAYTMPTGDVQSFGEYRTRGNRVLLLFSDHGSEDGDRVEILRNGNVVSANVTLRNEVRTVWVNLQPGRNRITFRALNEGTSSPNTAKFFARDNDYMLLVKAKEWSLNTGDSAEIVVIRQ